MPSDANGVYTLPDGYLAQTGQTILASQHNPPLEDLGESMSQRVMASGAKPMSGPLKFADGTASTPSATFNSAQTTGIYKTANGIGFSVAGTQVAELTSAGFLKGARYIGELIPYTGHVALPLTVIPQGQTLNRASYPDLWAFAQLHIASGNTFYNNGNGTTTFGIGDTRGRVIAGVDALANRLGSSNFGTSANVIGAAGGVDTHTLTLAQIPTGITSSGSFTSSQSTVVTSNADTTGFSTGSGGVSQWNAWPNGTAQSRGAITGSLAVTSNNTSGGAHNNVQPTIIAYFLLFAGA